MVSTITKLFTYSNSLQSLAGKKFSLYKCVINFVYLLISTITKLFTYSNSLQSLAGKKFSLYRCVINFVYLLNSLMDNYLKENRNPIEYKEIS